jgi:hypothetical protein
MDSSAISIMEKNNKTDFLQYMAGGAENIIGTLRVVGFRSAFWYAVYRFQILSGISSRRTPLRSWEDILQRLPKKALIWDPDRQPAFFFDDPRTMGEALRSLAPQEKSDLKIEGGNIEKGSFRLWEDRYHELGFPPDWNRNPLTGRSDPASRHWTQVNELSTGDIKGLWELSRFSLAFRMARWYAISGGRRAPEVFWRLIESWLSANPPNAGPQWLSAQEAALRAMAWIFGMRAFARSPATTAERAAKAIAALDVHARRIAATLAYARAQNNNHLISEAAGLFTIGLMFPDLADAERWKATGRSLLEETAGQFFPDGGYIQHSINYHRLALQLYLWVLRLAEIHHQQFSKQVYDCVDRSLELLSALVDPETGRAPNFGHNDGALFLSLNSCDYEDYRPLLQTISRWRRRMPLWGEGPWDEDGLWLLGPGGLPESGRLGRNLPLPKGEPVSADDAGLYVLPGRTSRAIIRCALYHSRPAHADQLHLDLWWRGENIACDAGSYLYGGDPPWRNSLTHAGVHNTVTVDGMDQMRRSGRFGWSATARGVGMFFRDRQWRGAVDGYTDRRVRHFRSVEQWEEDSWIVIDDVGGAGFHLSRLHWLMPDFPWEWGKPDLEESLQNTLRGQLISFQKNSPAPKSVLTHTFQNNSNPSEAGWDRDAIEQNHPGSDETTDLTEKFRCFNLITPQGTVSLLLWSNPIAQWNVYRAGQRIFGDAEKESPVPAEIRGWRSMRYANKIPALSLAGWTKANGPVRFITVWTPPSARGITCNPM